MRISKIQKQVLFYLFVLEQKQGNKPVLNVDLLKLVNRSSNSEIAASNFRASCHTLKDHKLVNAVYNQSLKLKYQLTEKGREKAQAIYKELTGQAVL